MSSEQKNQKNIDNQALNLKSNANVNNQDEINIRLKAPIDYIYYVEWRQFAVNKERAEESEDNAFPPTAMQMTHSRALIGDFHHVIEELKAYHEKMSAASAAKQKKRVRFQADEKLYTCIPDVIQGCNINKIDKNSIAPHKKSPSSLGTNKTSKSSNKVNSLQDESKSSLDVTDEELLCTPQKNSKFLRLIKKSVIKNKLTKLFLRKSRSQQFDEEVSKPTKAVKKTMERSNSYCRHDDADNVILIGDLEIEEIDEQLDYEPEAIQTAEYSYV